MKLSEVFFVTRRELPNDENIISMQMLIKSGFINKFDNGIYSYSPFGFKVIENIKNVIRKHFNNYGANELLMPSLVYSDVFEKTDRKNTFGNEVFSFYSHEGILTYHILYYLHFHEQYMCYKLQSRHLLFQLLHILPQEVCL